MTPKGTSSAKFQPKDMVLAKMTGFPAWPSFVMPLHMISDTIMKAKKKTTNTCVIFIPDGDYNWMNEKSLELLSPEKLKNKLSKLPKDKLKPKARKHGVRTNNVTEALMAADGLEFDDFMEELADSNAAKDEDDEDAGADPDTDADEMKTSKKKSKALLLDEEDDSQINDANDDEVIVNGDNNSKSGDSDKKLESGAPVAKRQRKDRAIGKKTGGSALNSSVVSRTQTNGNQRASKKENGTASPKAVSQKDRQHHFWLCRVKLQRSLIQRNQSATPKDPKQFPPPSVDELLFARLILNRLDLYPVNVSLLRETKIHKVLKCILKDEDLAYPDSFRLHEKCEELLKKWKEPIEQLKNEKLMTMGSRADLSLNGDDSTSDMASTITALTSAEAVDNKK